MRGFGRSLKLGLVLPLVCGLISAAHSVNVSLASTNNTPTRRFTSNPYVPLLKDMETPQPELICPKALIFGLRGSGENPPEFLKDGKDLKKGQDYSNWKDRKFTYLNKYSRKNYLELTSGKFYANLFGETVGPHVQILRSKLAEKYKSPLKDIGIWSMGVDDLEFSISTPPQSFYNAIQVPSKRELVNPYDEFYRQIEKSITQIGGGIIRDPIERELATTNNILYALYLLAKHCPNIQEMTLIGYSQGAVIARFIAHEIRGMKKISWGKTNWGKTNLYLNLIADPLFDGPEGKIFVYDKTKGMKEKIANLSGVEGSMLWRGKHKCRPRFNDDVSCMTKIGDNGPGGGKVFYVAPSTFVQAGATGSMCTTNCKYLEAAPANWQNNDSKDPIRTWAYVSNQLKVVVKASEVRIGSGFQNSQKIVAQSDNNALNSAAVLARDYAGNSKTDWHLPSKDELYELMRNNFGDLSGGTYWSSSQSIFSEKDTAWAQKKGITRLLSLQYPWLKQDSFAVRPVRAFQRVTYEKLAKDYSFHSWCIWDDIVCSPAIKGSASHSEYKRFKLEQILPFYCEQLKLQQLCEKMAD